MGEEEEEEVVEEEEEKHICVSVPVCCAPPSVLSHSRHLFTSVTQSFNTERNRSGSTVMVNLLHEKIDGASERLHSLAATVGTEHEVAAVTDPGNTLC